MAGRKKKTLLPDLSPPQTICLPSETTPTPPSPTDTTATSTNGVGDQPIPPLRGVSGLDLNNDPPQSPIPSPRRRLRKYKVPEGSFLLFGKLHPKPSTLQPRMPPPPPTDTTARPIRIVADVPIPAASAVNGPQDNSDNTPPPPASGPKARVRPRRNGTAHDPNSIGVCKLSKGLCEANLWFPDVHIPGSSKRGLQLYLGVHRTKQEAKDVHDRAALKLFETEGVPPVLNSPESRHAEFMDEFKDWELRDFLWQFRRYSVCFSRGSSSMKGVSVIKKAKGNLFHSKMAYTYKERPEDGKVFYDFGKFASEEDAGKAYDRGVLFLHHEETEEQKLNAKTNFRPSTYSECEILGAGKKYNMRKPILPGSL